MAASFALPTTDDHEDSVGTLLSRLATEGRDYAEAEIAVVKAKAGIKITAYKTAAIFFVAAAVLALCGVIALLVGLILTLAPAVGPGWATLIVVGGTLVIAAILVWVGKSKLA